MNTQANLAIRLIYTTIALVLALALMALAGPAARAEILTRYQPQALIQAEQALEQGQPERALSVLHRQRAILRHDKYRSQGQALACQAYVQTQDLRKAQQACDEAVAHAGTGVIAGTYAPSGDRLKLKE